MIPISQPGDRRSFIKKSLAVSVAASQPAFLCGLVRASGGGGGTKTDTSDPYTSDPYVSVPDTTWNFTTVPQWTTDTGGMTYY